MTSLGQTIGEVIITATPDVIKAILGFLAARGHTEQVDQILARWPEFEACDELIQGRAENAKREAAARAAAAAGQTPTD